jgi:CO dehydrogenase maturation factor
MAFTIAISGKGGSGKTTLAAMFIRHIARNLKKPVLAVDADPNANLHNALGVEIGRTVAEIREEIIESKMKLAQKGVSKERIVEYEMQSSVREFDGFDLLTMGRPEGPGCYCYVNSLLRSHLGKLAASFPFVVIDNEAGMEHLSRRTTNDVDVLFVVADSTVVGVKSAKNIFDLVASLPIKVKKRALVLNQVPSGGAAAAVENALKQGALDVAGRILHDEQVAQFAAEGKSIFDLPDSNPAYLAATKIVSEYIKGA